MSVCTFIFILTLLMLAGCDPSSSTDVPQDILMFQDRSHPQYLFTYVFQNGLCFAQKATFPPYGNRSFYLCEDLPLEVLQSLDYWRIAKGDVTPPFLPGESHFIRVVNFQSDNSEPVVTFFALDNSKLSQWLKQLRDATIKEEYKVDELPQLIKSNAKLKSHLGFEDAVAK